LRVQLRRLDDNFGNRLLARLLSQLLQPQNGLLRQLDMVLTIRVSGLTRPNVSRLRKQIRNLVTDFGERSKTISPVLAETNGRTLLNSKPLQIRNTIRWTTQKTGRDFTICRGASGRGREDVAWS
jgi:hypothetical protein